MTLQYTPELQDDKVVTIRPTCSGLAEAEQSAELLLAFVASVSAGGFPLWPSWVRHRCLADLAAGRSWQDRAIQKATAGLTTIPDARTGTRVVGLHEALRRLCESGSTTVVEQRLHGLTGGAAAAERAGSLRGADLRQIEQVVAHWTAVAGRAAEVATPSTNAGG